MGTQPEYIANVLYGFLWEFLRGHSLGWAVLEVLFRLSDDPVLERRPDVAFVPFERWPQRRIPDTEAWHVIPALAVEVVSKSNTAYEIQGKVREYFRHGVLMVWVIYPKQQEVHIYEGGKVIRVLDTTDTLDGAGVIPGFQLAVGKLFEGLEKPA